jgi:hypothetical protein
MHAGEHDATMQPLFPTDTVQHLELDPDEEEPLLLELLLLLSERPDEREREGERDLERDLAILIQNKQTRDTKTQSKRAQR